MIRLPAPPSLSPARLVALVCAGQVLAQIGGYTWPALLPDFLDRWAIDNAEAGWITSAYYAAYVLAVPLLVTLTDRIDPKRVYLFGVACTVAAHLGFALLADGFWSAFAARALAGVGWAGTYMTGLKLLADRVEGRLMSRAVAGHAASIGVAGALSFAFAGGLAEVFGWQGAFVAAALCAAAAWAMAFLFVPWQSPKPAVAGSEAARPALFDFRPVFRNRSAMAYALAYCVHTWEMNALRGWAVAFLVFVAADSPDGAIWLPATIVATLMGLVGTWASVTGNELSIRFGRRRLIGIAMAGSILCAATIGFVGPLHYGLAAGFILAYAFFIWLDSSSLTAGTAGSAEPDRRGATLAVHSMLGYAGGFVGPIAVGWTLDAAGGMSTTAWGLAFLHVAGVMVAGRLAFVALRPKPLEGDRPQAGEG